MHPHNAYRRSRAETWTRIEMLLEIYDACLTSLHAGRDALQHTPTSQLAPQIILKAQQRLLLLLEGVNVQHNPSGVPMQQLLSACVQWVARPDIRGWQAAIRIITQFREAFQTIRAEASQLELTGAIPPLDWRWTAGGSIA
ncbi:MAG: hypothetical protein ACK5Q5_07305 [Planctomycetaceae bacterium]